MRSKYDAIDPAQVKTFPMAELSRIVHQDQYATPTDEGLSFSEFIRSLPDILAAKELRTFSEIIAEAALNKKAVIAMFGGHVVKTGLAPLMIDWMQRGVITAMATHGAAIIHDCELALFGRTSEDVAAGLADGRFGMVRETADFINGAIADPDNRNLGFGEALGKALIDAGAEYSDSSLLCTAYKCEIPFTVHVAIGTDIIHQHPSADGASIGRASLHDFRIFANQVGRLTEGSVVLNIGSAVIMPEVFLKALSVARNIGQPAHGFAAANFDMFTHYRPTQNVLNRPTLTGGRKFNFIGHHEIMIPLLHAMVNDVIAGLNTDKN